MSARQLLETVSALGTMPRTRFDEVYDLLMPVPNEASDGGWGGNWLRQRYFECLDALGHCELSSDYSRLTVCSPAFVRLPGAGCLRVVLTGARDQSLLTALWEYVRKHIGDIDCREVRHDYAGRPLPDAMIVEAVKHEQIAQCAQHCGVAMCAPEPIAWQLLCVSGSLPDYEKTLDFQLHEPPNWLQRTFRLDDLDFKRNNSRESPRLVSYQNPTTHQIKYWWVEAGQASLINRYWGQYLALARANKNVLRYDERRQILAVPETVPFPRLLARAATLCSGRITRLNQSSGMTNLLLYRNVPKPIAEGIARKLGQSLPRQEFSDKDED